MSEEVRISTLEYPDNVRLRKEMYLMNPNHCVEEIIDNSVDEHLAGYCKNISINVSPESGLIQVSDDGRGIPVEPSTDPAFKGKSQLFQAMASLHSGGKFQSKDGAYKSITGGLNGVGASCVNAVSSYFKAQVFKEGYEYSLVFEKGRLKENCQKTEIKDKKKHGTTISFILDIEIWKDDTVDYKKLKDRIQQIAFLNPSVSLTYTYDKEGPLSYHYPEGLQTYLDMLVSKEKRICDSIILHKKENDIEADLGFTFSPSYQQEYYTFVNNVETSRAGDHLAGFKFGIHKAISQYLKDNKMKTPANMTQDDCLEGIVAIIAVKVKDPKFEGQGKTAIRMPELRTVVSQLTCDAYYEYLSKNPKIAKTILDKITQAMNARVAARKARQAVRDQKSIMKSISLPGKLKSCSSRDPEKTEIFLVEGDSAAGSALQARNANIQAILSVFGKVKNVQKGKDDITALNSVKLLDIIKALGTDVGKNFNLDKLRYHKIILMADADSDGGHIACLLITFFYRYLRPIIDSGYLYIAQSPLFSIQNKKGKIIKYIYTQSEMDNYEVKEGEFVNRYKGLGEMDPEELWETTMDPEKRYLIQITSNMAEQNEACINVCMGSDVAPRRKFIFDYAEF